MTLLSPDSAGGSGCASQFDFSQSHWAKVLNTAAHSATETETAWTHLCQSYWFPLYAQLRSSGLAKNIVEETLPVYLAVAQAQTLQPAPASHTSRLRLFLLATLKSFLLQPSSVTSSSTRLNLTIDWVEADRQFQAAAATLPPESVFEYEWKRALLAQTIARLRAESEAAGKGKLFSQLITTLSAGQNSSAFAEVARSLDLEEGAVRVAVLRLRKQYRTLLREEVAHTVAEVSLVDLELQSLFGTHV